MYRDLTEVARNNSAINQIKRYVINKNFTSYKALL